MAKQKTGTGKTAPIPIKTKLSKELLQKSIVEITRLVQAFHKNPNGENVINPRELDRFHLIEVLKFLKYDQGLSNTQIADILKRSRQTVISLLKELELKEAVVLRREGFDLYSWVLRLINTAETVKVNSARKNDWRTYFNAELELFSTLQDAGLLPKRAQRVEVTASIEQAQNILNLFKSLGDERIEQLTDAVGSIPERDYPALQQ